MRYLDDQGNVTGQFLRVVQELAEATNHVPTEIQIRVYARHLDDVPFERLEAAVARHLTTGKFFPAISELRQLAGEASPDDKALLAWAALERAAESVGAYGDVIFQDPAAAVAVQSLFGSWPAVCEIAGDGPAWGSRRQEFLATYRAASRTIANNKHVRLPGLCALSGAEQLPIGEREWVGLVSTSGTVRSVQRTRQLGAVYVPAVLPDTQTQKRIPQKGQGETGAAGETDQGSDPGGSGST